MRGVRSRDKILGSIREARAILRGEGVGELVVHVPPEFDVKALRSKLGRSQSRLALSFGFGLAAAQSSEQGRRRPRGRRASSSRWSSTSRTRCGAPWPHSCGRAELAWAAMLECKTSPSNPNAECKT
jgi:hypothetical protein